MCTSPKVSIPSAKKKHWNTKSGKAEGEEKINDDIVESIHTMESAMRDFPNNNNKRKGKERNYG